MIPSETIVCGLGSTSGSNIFSVTSRPFSSPCMVVLLACRGGVRTFAAACGWRTSLSCLLGALAAAPGSVAMLAHRLIAFQAALARWRFRFQAVIEFFGFLGTHHSHVSDVRSA